MALPAFTTEKSDVTGRWEVTTSYPGGTSVAALDLSVDHGRYQGKSGWLIPDWAVFFYTGVLEKNVVRLKITYDGGSSIGDLAVRNDRGSLRGSGTPPGEADAVGTVDRATPALFVSMRGAWMVFS